MKKKVIAAVLGIFVLAIVYFWIFSFLNQTSSEIKGPLDEGINPDLVCISDSDCIPSGCCHPNSCVNKINAQNCSGVLCTMDCKPGTLDCGQGSCQCLQGSCQAVYS